MDEGRHAYEASTMDVKYDCFWYFLLAFKELGNWTKELINIAY